MHFKDAICIRTSPMNNIKQMIKKTSLETLRKQRKITLYASVIRYASLFKEAGNFLNGLTRAQTHQNTKACTLNFKCH